MVRRLKIICKDLRKQLIENPGDQCKRKELQHQERLLKGWEEVKEKSNPKHFQAK